MSRAGAVAASPTAPPRPVLLPLAGAVLLVAGIGLAGLALVERPAPVDRPPFEERSSTAVPEALRAEVAALLPGAGLERLELVARPTGVTVASATLLRPGDAVAVLLGWESGLAEPILHPDIDPAEELRLAQALRRHLPAGAPLFALPERSRRLAALAGLDAPLAGADDTAGLRVPEPWLPAAAAIRARERERAGLHRPDPEAAAAFAAFADALLAPAAEGAARLQVLSGGRTAFLALHVADAFTLGLLRPEAVAVGLHDLPAAAALHDTVRLVKAWLQEEGHAAYAALPRGREVLRVLFLSREADTRLLLAQLLPFDRADLGSVPALRLVFQDRGYWVYRIDPVVAEPGKS
jgi:hydroxylamine oxidation protein HaoB